jgi:2-(1,2-epoxy-1,2-dihydrophenyl)acetyl-CoA isomerase
MPDAEPVTFEVQDRVAIVTLDHPQTMNALGDDLLRELGAAIERANADASVRALLIRGIGRAFSAGADLEEIRHRLESGGAASVSNHIGDLLSRRGNPVVNLLRSLPMPLICAVNGVAAGGGVGLALAADIVIAARSAYFYLPFVPRLGLIPDLGATWALAHKVGRARALGLALTGSKLSAADAERWGLIWRCAPDESFAAEAMALAQDLSRLPREATKSARELIDHAAANSFAAQVEAECEAQRTLAASEAFREGLSAFLEKRTPHFP